MKIGCRILVISALACLSAGMSAQNLDPTVVVSREYEGKLMEVHKPKLEMAVPDSVLRFDLDFDYSVSDRPYKGAYDFSPYILDMRPAPAKYESGILYLNAGAGYQLRPEFDLVWSPVMKKPSFRMNVFAHHRSYIGRYQDIAPVESDGAVVFEPAGKDMVWNGMEMFNRAGFDGRVDWKKGTLGFDAGYYGIYQQDMTGTSGSRSFNAFDASLAIKSKDSRDASFGYDVKLDYRYGNDARISPEIAPLSENIFGLEASLVLPLKKAGRLRIDVDSDLVGYGGCFNAAASLVSLTPHYVRLGKTWDIDLGVRLSAVLRDKNMTDMYQDRIQVIYPDFRVGLKAIPSIYIYAAVTGGPELETYSSLLASDSRVNPSYLLLSPGMLDMTDNSVKAEAGIEGRITTRFTYAVRGGYSRFDNAPLSAVCFDGGMYCPGIAYSSYSKLFAALDCRLETERLDFAASAGYSHFMTTGETEGFLPSAFVADASFRYNWMKRIYAGVTCEVASARRGYIRMPGSDAVSYVNASVPGYVDLGVNLEYVFSRRLSCWIKGWNLLGMTVQRSIFYAEKGPGFTVGVCFNM